MTRGMKLFLIAFLLSLPFWWGLNFFQENLEKFFYAQIGQPFEEMVFVKIPERVQRPPLELDVKSAISLKISKTGRERIVFQKNPEEILPIASLTKLMTAVIVLDYNPPTTHPTGSEVPQNYYLENTWITISPEAANQKDVPVYGNLKAGERFNLKQLLDLALIYSSNDSAFALSEVIGVENFVEKMNQTARELKLENTNFVNPTGLDPENLYYHLPNREYFNYSTAKDLVKLAQYILFNHPLIFEISLERGPYLVRNGLFDLSLPAPHQGLGGGFKLIGGKTGYTDEAGGCFLIVFQDEKESFFFNLILGTKRENRVGEMQKLIDWLNI